MPSSHDIRLSLGQIANDAFAYAVVWHLIVGAACVALLAGWRPRARTAGLLSSAPLVSVSVFAWVHGNAFNGTLFALLAGVLVVLARREQDAQVCAAEPVAALLGAALVAFGWTYPHFLVAPQAPFAYLYAAPLGLIPCPTLSLAIGLLLLQRARPRRAASLVLGAAAVFYGAFGALRLGVWIDVVLLVGGCALLVRALVRRSSEHEEQVELGDQRSRG